MILFHRKKKLNLNAYTKMLYCPAFDMNCLHILNRFHNMAICAGCGDVIKGVEEIKRRKKIAQMGGNRYKILAEERDK
jgi:hypothetical protein